MNFIDKKIEDYAISKSSLPSKTLDELEIFTKENVEIPQMLIGKMEASFLGFLLRTINAKTVVEIGTYTGYSALAMAENLSSDAKIFTLDINPETTKIAQSYWDMSPHGTKIIPLLGPALETINQIESKIDFAFIDADKSNYLNYLNLCLERLSEKGMIVVDNVLWSGSVLEKSDENSTIGIQKMNDFVSSNENLYGTLLPIRDGMFLIQKMK